MNDSETSSGQILRLTFSVEEVAQLLGLSRSAVYEAIARGDIPALRFGRRIVIARHALDQLLTNPTTEPSRAGDATPA